MNIAGCATDSSPECCTPIVLDERIQTVAMVLQTAVLHEVHYLPHNVVSQYTYAPPFSNLQFSQSASI